MSNQYTVHGNTPVTYLYELCDQYKFQMFFSEFKEMKIQNVVSFHCDLTVDGNKVHGKDISNVEFNLMIDVKNKGTKCELETCNYIGILQTLLSKQGDNFPVYEYSSTGDGVTQVFGCSANLQSRHLGFFTCKSNGFRSKKAAKRYTACKLLNILTDNEYEFVGEFPAEEDTNIPFLAKPEQMMKKPIDLDQNLKNAISNFNKYEDELFTMKPYNNAINYIEKLKLSVNDSKVNYELRSTATGFMCVCSVDLIRYEAQSSTKKLTMQLSAHGCLNLYMVC